jgi:predicted  nucleic acid-binding Zn-ribbon protein
MLMLKARHAWSDTSFNDLLRILADIYLEGNKMPANTYRVKKLIRPVAMKLKKSHACPNHCILYRGKYENLQSCPHCGTSRYKRNAGCRADADDEREPKKKKIAKKTTTKKQIPSPEDEEEEGYTQRKISALSMWYLPVIDHLRAIFRNPKDTKLMSWHASDERMKGDGKLRHPTNGKQWKRFDIKFLKEFGDEAMNIRFALSTDGMNPFGDLSSSHSTWSFILTIYNLPP